jgi:hypothetical protein
MISRPMEPVNEPTVTLKDKKPAGGLLISWNPAWRCQAQGNTPTTSKVFRIVSTASQSASFTIVASR